MSALIDSHGRRIDYLRLSLTDRCDLRCRYCIPDGFCDFEAPANWLTPAQIEHAVAAFASLGVRRVRLTGGEPLTRRDAIDIATRISKLPGIDDLSLTTNGTQLALHAAQLNQSGIRRLNISLDTLQQDRFHQITGFDALQKVLGGIDAAIAEGFPLIKINMVMMQGINDDETSAMVDFCMERNLVLRMIEPMPMGGNGRAVVPANLETIRHDLQRRYGLVDGLVPGGGPARYLQSHDKKFSVGFITPLSQHFCDTCNRVRLSAEGILYTCLGQNDHADLGALLRAGAAQGELVKAIQRALNMKPARHGFLESTGKVVRVMAKTGG